MLNEILATPTKDMFKLIKTLLVDIMGEGRTDDDNYLFYHKNKSPLLLQAHIDTVADAKRYKNYQVYGNNVISSNGILGADDRAGVFAICKIVEICKKNKYIIPNILFTNFEESGGGGMKEFVKKYPVDRFKGINLAISIDRRGCNDYVSYVDNPKEIETYIEDIGFVSSFGSYSDVKDFSEHTKIPSVNVSAGYYSPHSTQETLHLDELQMTINRIIRIINNPIEKLYPIEVKKYTLYSRYNQGNAWENNEFGYDHVWDKVWNYTTKRYEWYKESKKTKEESNLSGNGTQCELCGSSVKVENIWDKGEQRFMMLCESCARILKN